MNHFEYYYYIERQKQLKWQWYYANPFKKMFLWLIGQVPMEKYHDK